MDKNEIMDEIYDKDTNVEEILNIYEKINGTEHKEDMDPRQIKFMEKIEVLYDEEFDTETKNEELNRAKKSTLNRLYDIYQNYKKLFDKK